MKVVIDKETQTVVGLNRPATVFEIEVEAPDTQDVQEGMTFNDLLYEKNKLLKTDKYNMLIESYFINEDDIDFNFELHNADTGIGFIKLHPKGYICMKSIDIDSNYNDFDLIELYSTNNDGLFIECSNNIDNNKITVVIGNITDKPIEIKSFILGLLN